MSSIYTNSAITIVAKAAENPTRGCLQPRHFDTETRSFPCPSSEKGKKSAIYVRRPRNCHKTGEIPVVHDFSPPGVDWTGRRAWILQETLLSPRILLCGYDELGWQCKEEVRCECTDVSTPTNYVSLDCQFLRSKLGLMKFNPTANPLRTWFRIVTQFTSRELGVPTDRLAGTSGLADRMSLQGYFPGKYIAGIWESGLPVQLLWQTRHWGDEKQRPKRLPKPYAPSWSWASVTGQVHYSFLRGAHPEGHPSFEVLDVACKQATPNPYGSMAFALLKVRGLLMRADLTSPVAPEASVKVQVQGLPTEAWPQTSLDVVDGKTLPNLFWGRRFVLLVGFLDQESKSRFYGLLLRQEDRKQEVFTREGLVSWGGPQSGYLNQIINEERVVILV